jgi:hypothetical protein
MAWDLAIFPHLQTKPSGAGGEKLLWHCLWHIIKHKISYKIISNTLANVEYSPSYGQKI